MGYIKKLKNNELVGGTDKTTIYPVTSTEAVFEEITNGSESSFKSQKTINSEHDGRIKGLEEKMPDTVKSITINGSKTKTYTVDDTGNVDLTIYSDGGQDYEGLTEVVANLRDIVGENPEEPQSGTLLERVDTLEDAVGTGGSVDQRISDAVTIEKNRAEGIEGGLQTQINGKQNALSVGAGITLTSEGVISATADPSVGKVVESLPLTDIIDGMIYLVQKANTPGTYIQWVHYGNDWTNKGEISLGITTDDTLDSTSSNPIQNAAVAAQIGYFVCGNGYASSEIKDVDALGFKLPDVGGDFKIKMNAANTHAGPVYLRFNSSNNTKAELKYNRESVSPTNTWEENEVISVYFDGTYYQASNAQGGGGKAKKIKYDNSASGLAAENVQGALDESSSYIVYTEIDVASISAINFGLWGDKWHSSTNGIQTKKVDVTAGQKCHIVSDPSYITQIFFMATYNPSNNASVVYQVTSVQAGQEGNVTVPQGMAYMVFQDDHERTGGGGSTKFPSEVSLINSTLVKDVVSKNKNDISFLEDVVGKNIDTTQYNEVQAFMTPANGGTWYTSASTNRGKFIPILAGNTYRIKSAEQYSYYAFLTSDSYGNNNTPVTTFADGETCHIIRDGSVVEEVAPSDAKYLYISTLNGTIDCTPAIQTFGNLVEYIDKLIGNGDAGEITYDLNVFPLQACLNAGTYWAGSTNRSIFIPIKGGQVFKITTNENNIAVISFHTSNTWSTATSTRTINNYAHGEYTRYDLAKGCTHILISPSDAKYMCVYIKSNDSTIYTPNEIVKLDVSNASVITQKLEASKLASINTCRNAHVVSESKYIYTFPIDSLVLKDNEFIINYNASETSTDVDTVAGMESTIHCLDKVSVLDYTTVNGLEPSYTIEKTDLTIIQGFVGWTARVLVNNNMCVLGVCRQTNKNPFYVYAILDGDEESFVYKECKLKYTPTGGSQTTVDFTVNNYRQMLVDCGFASSYLASQGEAVDNCNLCYENGVYYIFTATSPASALPLLCLKSSDLETWEVVGQVLSNNMRINEVSVVVKNGIGYVMYRTKTQGSFANFAIYDIANNVLINSGVFNDAVESRADVFTFEGDVYLAYNVLPSTYKSTTSLVRPDQGGRNEINVYKVVDNNPMFFRRICNPTGLNYFRFRETPVYIDSMNTWWNQGAIYMAYSEDRRHLYRRQFANISIADVTAVFADSEECN